MSKKRKAISKKTRQLVYNKYNGRCAYCGKQITMKQLRVDHFIPFRRKNSKNEDEIESIDNYIPACHSCNYYKRARSPQSMKRDIKKLPQRLQTLFIYRLAKRYGLIQQTPKDIVYLYEQEGLK